MVSVAFASVLYLFLQFFDLFDFVRTVSGFDLDLIPFAFQNGAYQLAYPREIFFYCGNIRTAQQIMQLAVERIAC